MKNSAFIRFFTCFPKLFAAGFIYSVCLAAFSALFVLIGYLLGFNNIVIWGLGIIPSAPLLAGLNMVIRKTAAEKTDIEFSKVFFGAVRDNYKAFLLHGFVIYLIVQCTFFAILYYGVMAYQNITYASILTIYMLFTAILVTAMFYVALMSITYELRLRDVYKNAFILTFGKILRNLGAIALVLLVSATAFFAILYAEGPLRWTAVGLVFLLCPLIICYIAVSIISKGVQESVGSFIPEPEPEEDESELQNAIKSADGDSDYVYVNGKMVKIDK